MHTNNKFDIDPAMFTKPPPNFKTVSLVQPFKPNVPPPPYVKNSSHVVLSPNSTDEANYYLMMLYRYHDSTNSRHPNPFAATDLAKSFPLPPPHISAGQPPLPVIPPPSKPPPPPPTLTPSVSMGMGNFQNRTPPSVYGHSYTKIYNNFKRKFDGIDVQKKLQKKKKKPLSQVVPQRRDWTMEEAKRALDVEKDCNKRSKRQGLIIKFPDLELNRDIVSNFHTSIESVHFQQPSTARYCFVTLKESAEPETVINQLNKIPFGLGYLSAEFKKDREDEQNIKPSDIDPLTLYVGNLAQEITKDDMEKKYPKRKRIDIGYAKKMKYTRYAFVSFHTVDDAIEAFQNTHSSQMYSKSLIVRFRRLHGTVGMPGEPKQINQRFEAGHNFNILENCNFTPESEKDCNRWDIDVSHWENKSEDTTDKRLDIPTSDDDESEEMDIKPPRLTNYSIFKPGSLEIAFSLHKPKVVKEEKCSEDSADCQYDSSYNEDYSINEVGNTTRILDYQSANNDYQRKTQKNIFDEPDQKTTLVNIKKEKYNNSSSTYDYLRKINKQMYSDNTTNPLKPQSYVKIKQECENEQDFNVYKQLPQKNNQRGNSTSSNNHCRIDAEVTENCTSSNASLLKNNTNNTGDQTNYSYSWNGDDYRSTVIKTETTDCEQR